jgi:dGTPase
VSLTAVSDLALSRRVLARLSDAFTEEPNQWRRQSLLIRGLIHLLVTDVLEATAARMSSLAARHGIDSRERFLPLRGKLSARTVWFSAEVEPHFRELKAFIYQFIINHWQVNRQDWRARKVITALFRAYWTNPLTLPTYVLLRAREELGFPFLRDIPFAAVADEIASRYHTSAGFARLVADHIAGMSDRFALEEYQSLEQPATEQRFLGDLR